MLLLPQNQMTCHHTHAYSFSGTLHLVFYSCSQRTRLWFNILSWRKGITVFSAPEQSCLCLILAFFRTNQSCQAPHGKHSWERSDHLSQHTQWCLCLRALPRNLCLTQLEWLKVLLISSCLSCPSPGDESVRPGCSAAAAASPTYYLKSTLVSAWHQDSRLRMWKWVKTVQAEGQVESCVWEYLKTTL